MYLLGRLVLYLLTVELLDVIVLDRGQSGVLSWPVGLVIISRPLDKRLRLFLLLD